MSRSASTPSCPTAAPPRSSRRVGRSSGCAAPLRRPVDSGPAPGPRGGPLLHPTDGRVGGGPLGIPPGDPGSRHGLDNRVGQGCGHRRARPGRSRAWSRSRTVLAGGAAAPDRVRRRAVDVRFEFQEPGEAVPADALRDDSGNGDGEPMWNGDQVRHEADLARGHCFSAGAGRTQFRPISTGSDVRNVVRGCPRITGNRMEPPSSRYDTTRGQVPR